MAQTAHLTRATPLTGAEMQQMATLGPSFISTINIYTFISTLFPAVKRRCSPKHHRNSAAIIQIFSHARSTAALQHGAQLGTCYKALPFQQ